MIGAAYLVLLQSAARAITPPRPSIVLIMADDLGYRSLGCYGNHDIDTPHIDRLAANGMRLTDFHSNGPMCSPTRAALMTGRYQQRCRWVDDSDLSPAFQGQRRDNVKQRWAWGISPQETTVAVLLQHAGYRTVLIGKWHLGYDRAFHPMNYGFDEFHGFVGGAVDYHTHIATHGLQDLDWWRDRTLTNDAGYSTDLLTRYATEFIDRHKADPFFLYVAHAAPHVPLQGRNPAGSDPPAATYREMIEALDDSVGAIVSKLGEHDLSGNTIVVFCSDNGADPPGKTPANGPLRGKKGSVFEGGHRVPCIAAWPCIVPDGITCGHPAMSMDLLPTFARLAGAVLPEGHQFDGVDIMPLVKTTTKRTGRDLHWLFGDAWASRTGPWKLIGHDDTPEMLFDLDDDSTEQSNLPPS